MATEAERAAITAWNLLSTGSGAFDLGALPVVVELLGVQDVEGLIDRLLIIKLHRPEKQNKE